MSNNFKMKYFISCNWKPLLQGLCIIYCLCDLACKAHVVQQSVNFQREGETCQFTKFLKLHIMPYCVSLNYYNFAKYGVLIFRNTIKR